MAKTKDEIIQEAISCLEDIVYECSQERKRGNHAYEYIEQTSRGYVSRIKRLVEEESQAAVRKAFNME